MHQLYEFCLELNGRELPNNLLAIGFFSKSKKGGEEVYSIPFFYRHGMNRARYGLRNSKGI